MATSRQPRQDSRDHPVRPLVMSGNSVSVAGTRYSSTGASTEKRCKCMPVYASRLLKVLVALAIVINGVWIVFVSGDVLTPWSKNEPNRGVVAKLHRRIALGIDYPEVLEIYWKERVPGLRLDVD